MSQTKLAFICLFIVLMLPLNSFGEIYKYVDEKGFVVFTDDLVKVPENQRIKETKYDENVQSQQKHLNIDVDTSKHISELSENDMFFIKQLKMLKLIDENADTGSVTHSDLMLLKNYFKNGDRRILTQLRDMGLISETKNFKVENVTDEQWERIKNIIEGQGVLFRSIGSPPDPRFSSPEKTWELYKNALIEGNFELALQCLTLRRAEEENEIINALGKDNMRKIAEEMRPIQKIKQDEETAKYRIRKTEEYGEKMLNITYYIYFVNMFGNWKIENY